MTIRGKKIRFPIFLPDATKGVIRSLDSGDLKQAGIKGIVVNTYHLMYYPGSTVIKKLGGIHKFMNWDGIIASDSGGFQLFSLIQRKRLKGRVTDMGIKFSHPFYGKKMQVLFTPENSIQVQFDLDSDIMIVLDCFTPPSAGEKEAEDSVNLTIGWARRCKKEYEKQVKQKKLKDNNRPLLFAVIQGGVYNDLRKYCARELQKIGFDGYGLGGWPKRELITYNSTLTSHNLPKFALGVGSLQDIVDGFKDGYNIFDCVLPTRDARHKRLYAFKENPEKTDILNNKNLFDYIYIHREKYVRDSRAISKFCSCLTCKDYSRAYLNHLFKIDDVSAFRLATIHNLRIYSLLINTLRKTL